MVVVPETAAKKFRGDAPLQSVVNGLLDGSAGLFRSTGIADKLGKFSGIYVVRYAVRSGYQPVPGSSDTSVR